MWCSAGAAPQLGERSRQWGCSPRHIRQPVASRKLAGMVALQHFVAGTEVGIGMASRPRLSLQ